MVGERLSHYRIEARLGRGGMGEVLLARDLALGRTVVERGARVLGRHR